MKSNLTRKEDNSSVNPGMIDTNIFDGGLMDAELLEEDRKRYPLKRYGKPEEVAYAVIYLLSNSNKVLSTCRIFNGISASLLCS